SLTVAVDVVLGAGATATETPCVELFWPTELTAPTLFFFEQPVIPTAVISRAATNAFAALPLEPIRRVVPDTDRSVFALICFIFITSAACAVTTAIRKRSANTGMLISENLGLSCKMEGVALGRHCGARHTMALSIFSVNEGVDEPGFDRE